MATITKRPGKKGATAYRAEVRRKGYPKQIKTFELRGDAEKWARKVEREIDAGTWKDLKGAESILLSEALDRYLSCISTKKQPSTYKRDELSISHLKKRLGHFTLLQTTDSEVAMYRDLRLNEVSPDSVRIELSLLSNLFNIARLEWNVGKLENPVKSIKKPKIAEGRCPILNQEQLKRLIDESKAVRTKWLFPFVLVALHTGCRSNELRSMRWPQVVIEDNVGFINIIGSNSKNQRTRTVPLTKPALECLSILKQKHKHVDSKGNPIGVIFPANNNIDKPRDLHKAFNEAVSRASLDNMPGLGKLRIHDLRHCCGSALVMAGVDIETIRQILGHRDISTTQRYLHVVNEHMQKSMNKIEHLGV